MSVSDTLRDRLDFARIDQETCALLRECRPLVAAALPGILDEFYGPPRGRSNRKPRCPARLSDAERRTYGVCSCGRSDTAGRRRL